jgi:uncharacterized protein
MVMSKAAFRIVALLAALLFSLMPVRAQSPVSDTQAAARELITTMKFDDQFKALMPGIMTMIKPAIVQNRPDVEREFDALMPMLMAGMQARIGELLDAVVAVYVSNFSADELRAATAFYRTPAGQKFLQKNPLVAQQTMLLGQKFGQSVGAEAQKRMIEELRRKGYTL